MTVDAAPAAAAAAAAAALLFCHDGVRSGDDSCCAAQCGVCGGRGCGMRRGGETQCCPSVFSKLHRPCSDFEPPCTRAQSAEMVAMLAGTSVALESWMLGSAGATLRWGRVS